MAGLDWNDPMRIRSPEELISWIKEIGFLPLFANGVPGFSVEEHVCDQCWWTGDPEQDPWVWREIIAASGEVAYGRFFNKKVGFVSLDWFPIFANVRREGYDFDARWEDGHASYRCKKIMDLFLKKDGYTGLEIKRAAGFGKDGEKNFEGTITDLQMQTYLVVREFRKKRSKKGVEYGMPVCVYATPESIWGYEWIASGYEENAEDSWLRIFARVLDLFPYGDEDEVKRMIGG